MPHSEIHEGKRARVYPKQESRQRVPSTNRSQAKSRPDMQAIQHPRESVLGSDFSQATFERHAALLSGSRMSHRMYRQQRAMIVQQLQRDYGNQYVQRLVNHISRQRSEAARGKLTVGPTLYKYEQEAGRVKQMVGMNEPPAQRQEELQIKPETASLRGQGLEEEEMLQGKFGPVQKEENKTGLPDSLKAGIEHLSGISMGDVKFQYNSPKPTPLRALAYTQGTDIHVSQGQEKHLAHEAWRVAQQKRGGVKQTLQEKETAINDEERLEHEADLITRRANAVQRSQVQDARLDPKAVRTKYEMVPQPTTSLVVQPKRMKEFKKDNYYKKNVFKWLMVNQKPAYQMTKKFEDDHLLPGNATTRDVINASHRRGDKLADGQVGTYSWIKNTPSEMLGALENIQSVNKTPLRHSGQQLQTKLSSTIVTVQLQAHGAKNNKKNIVHTSLISRVETAKDLYVVGNWDVRGKKAEAYHYGANASNFNLLDESVTTAKQFH